MFGAGQLHGADAVGMARWSAPTTMAHRRQPTSVPVSVARLEVLSWSSAVVRRWRGAERLVQWRRRLRAHDRTRSMRIITMTMLMTMTMVSCSEF